MLNDVLYARYRVALKFRKLQTSLLCKFLGAKLVRSKKNSACVSKPNFVCQIPATRVLFSSPLPPPPPPRVVEHHEINAMQEALLSSGIQNMSRQSEVVEEQLRSCISELYSALRMLRPSLPVNQLKEAEECCSTWISMVFRW